MLMGLVFAVLAALAVAAGGRMRLLAVTRLRWGRIAFAALFIQVVIITLAPGGDRTLHELIHVSTYALALAVCARNRRLPGVPAMAIGAALNLAAIVANDGVMPATEGALRTAGLPVDSDVYVNSGVTPDAHLAPLGDVFASPAWFPFHNVFSIGDLLIVAGAVWFVHVATGSRLAVAAIRLARRVPRCVVHFATSEHRLLRLEGALVAGAQEVVLVADARDELMVIPALPTPPGARKDPDAGGRPPLGFALPARLARARLFAVADGRAVELTGEVRPAAVPAAASSPARLAAPKPASATRPVPGTMPALLPAPRRVASAPSSA